MANLLISATSVQNGWNRYIRAHYLAAPSSQRFVMTIPFLRVR